MKQFLLIGLLAFPYLGTANNCAQLLYDPYKFKHVLQEVRLLLKLVQGHMGDPTTPLGTKLIFKKAIEQGNVRVRRLSDARRRRWKIPRDTAAMYTHWGRPFRTFRSPDAPLSLNEELTEAIQGFRRPPGGFQIVVSDRPLTQDNNDLIALLHEMAHVRFELALRRHLKRLVAFYPREVLYRSDENKVEIHRHFLEFIEEYYVRLKEWEFVRAMRGRMPNYYRYTNVLDWPEDEVRFAIAESVLDTYKLGSPLVRALALAPLRSLLNGKANELRLLIPTLKEMEKIPFFDQKEFAIAFVLAARSLYRDGVVAELYGFENADLALKQALRRTTNPLYSFIDILREIHYHAGAKRELLQWLDRAETRQILLRYLRWEPGPGPLSVRSLLTDLPFTRPVLTGEAALEITDYEDIEQIVLGARRLHFQRKSSK